MKELLDFMTALGTTDKPHHGKPTFINYSHLLVIQEFVEGILNATIFLTISGCPKV